MGDEYNDDDLDLSRLGDLDDDRSDGDEADLLKGPLETLKELMLDNPGANPRNTRHFLNRWYSVLPFRKEDLISALGGSHLFFIHGESLIMHILSKEFVSFESDFQILSVFYIVERHLDTLRKAGGLFRVVFFDSLRDFMCQFSPQAWLLRNALIAQLRNIEVDVFTFPCMTSDAFRNHLISWQPSFVLVSDEPCEVLGENAGVVPLTLLHTTLSLGIPAALFYRLDQIGQKVLAYSITPEYSVPSMRPHIEAICLDYLNSIPTVAPLANTANISAGKVDFTGCSAKLGGARLALHTAALNSVLSFALKGFESVSEASPRQEELLKTLATIGKAILIHAALLEVIKVPKRLFTTPDLASLPNGATRVVPILTQWAAALSAVVELNSNELNANITYAGDLADIIDGRLISAIITRTLQSEQSSSSSSGVSADFFGLPEVLIKSIESSWSAAVAKVAPSARTALGSAVFPFSASVLGFEGLVTEMPAPAEKRADPQAVKIKSFLSVECDGVVDIPTVPETDSWSAPDVSAAMAANNIQPVFLDAVKEQTEPSKKEDEVAMLTGWAKRRFASLPEHKRETFLKKIRLKRAQQQQSALRAYAKSLTGADKLHFPIIVRDEKSGVAQAQQAAHAEKFEGDGSDDSDSDNDNNNTVEENGKASKKVAAAAKKAEKAAKKAEKEAKKAEKTKVSTRAAAIIEKNERAQKEKMKQQDDENLVKIDKRIQDLARDVTNLNTFCAGLYDLAAGMYRAMDIFGDFDGLKSTLKLSESRAEVAIRLIKASMKVLSSLTKSALSTISMRAGTRKTACIVFRLIHDAYSTFKSVWTGEQMMVLQDSLLSMGFEVSCANLWNDWISHLIAKAVNEKEADKDGDKKEAADKKAAKKAHPMAAQNGKDAEKSKKDAEKAERDLKKISDKVESEVKKFRVLTPAKRCEIQIPKGTDASYQLENMPQDLERTTGSEADERVRFKPDRWQRRLLDIVDGKFNKEQISESALVIAPTGSGKTFICYYAMEKILRKDNESRVVYVAPSKALVLQVSAEIYARFSSKQYSPLAKIVLQGEMLKEFQNKALDCQILITVPECLEMLLFNPVDVEKQKWLKSLKYVIFDEVHCIGNLDSGAVWERLFQLLPCPFLALSATVGNPHAFHAWLQRVHKKPKVHLVSYDERYSDLNKYVYRDSKLTPLHTVACFNFRQLKEHGFPFDLYLTPPETLQLIRALQQIDVEEKTRHFAILDHFNPDHFFQGCRAVTKKQYRMFLAGFKLEFMYLVQVEETITEAIFSRVIDKLNAIRAVDRKIQFSEAVEFKHLPPIKSKEAEVEKVEEVIVSAPDVEMEENGEAAAAVSLGSLRTEKTYLNPGVMIGLVRHLMAHDMLPSIVFNFSRDELHKMIFGMLKKFGVDQHYKYYGTEEAKAKTKALNKKRMDEYERRVKEKEMNENLKQVSRRQAEEQGIDYDETANEDLGPPPGDIAEEFDPEFSFANNRVYRANISDIEDQFNIVKRAISKMKAKQAERNERLLDALRRGIGIHHEGTNKKYRQVVEVLFRSGFLRVVLATGTLALGVNMPCKTTVFAGDSLDLTPLMYRQMSGRAGRRGFDPLGHVIFMDFPQATLQRLMTSRLGSLTGSYPLTSSLVLRSLQLEAFCEDSDRPRTRKAIQKLFTEPLCAVPNEDASAARNKTKKGSKAKAITEAAMHEEEKNTRLRIQTQVFTHLKMSLDALYREGMLDKSGDMVGFASMSTFLYEDAPSNLALARLLVSGALRKRIEAITTTSKDIQEIRRKEEEQNRELLLILSHILHRRYLTRQVLLSNQTNKTTSGFSNLSPILPPLPEDIREILADVDNVSQRSASDAIFGHCRVIKLSSSEEMTLPLSKAAPVVAAHAAASTFDSSEFTKGLKFLSAPKARAPLHAINGKGDDFTSAAEIVDCARNVAIVETSMVSPAFTAPAAKELRNLQNSYILDFYVHGDVDRLKSPTENRMDATDAYNAVQSFITSIRNLATALERMQVPAATPEEQERRKEHPDQLLLTLRRLVDILDAKRHSVAA